MLPLESLHSYSLIPNGAVTAGRKLQERKLSGALYGTAEKTGVNLTNYNSGPGQTYSRTDTVHLPTRQNSVASSQSEQSLLSRLTSRSRQDSSYSSMSSGRTSPSSIK